MTTAFDKQMWTSRSHATYSGFKIVPKLDFSQHERDKGIWGWVVTENGCNALPAATWARSQDEATALINIFLAADRDAGKFWNLLFAMRHFAKAAAAEAKAA